MVNPHDNLLLANCDTWTSMHCRHVRPKRRESLMVSMEKMRQSKRMRPGSAKSERKRSGSPLKNSMRKSKKDSTQDDLNMRASLRSSKSTKSMLPAITDAAPETPAKTEPVASETQSNAPADKSQLDLAEMRSQEARSQQNYSAMLQQTERIH